MVSCRHLRERREPHEEAQSGYHHQQPRLSGNGAVPVLTRDYLDTLEESLYIWWELRPVSRMWKAELVQTGVTAFVYASEEPALVRWVGDLAYTVEW